jgi:hypothetical protein
MVSPVHGDYRRCQAEIPLIVLFRFPEPALFQEERPESFRLNPENPNRNNGPEHG